MTSKFNEMIAFMKGCVPDPDAPHRVRINSSRNVVFLDAPRRISITVSHEYITFRKYDEAGQPKKQRGEQIPINFLTHTQKTTIMGIIDSYAELDPFIEDIIGKYF